MLTVRIVVSNQIGTEGLELRIWVNIALNTRVGWKPGYRRAIGTISLCGILLLSNGVEEDFLCGG